MNQFIVYFLSFVVGTSAFAGPSGVGGGGDLNINRSTKSDIKKYLATDARIDLVKALQGLQGDEVAAVIPADLNTQMLVALITTVIYRLFVPSEEQRHLMQENGAQVTAITSLNRISPDEIKQLVSMGRDLREREVISMLSPITFDMETLTRKMSSSSDLLTLMYFMHLTQLGKGANEVNHRAAALSQIINSQK